MTRFRGDHTVGKLDGILRVRAVIEILEMQGPMIDAAAFVDEGFDEL